MNLRRPFTATENAYPTSEVRHNISMSQEEVGDTGTAAQGIDSVSDMSSADGQIHEKGSGDNETSSGSLNFAASSEPPTASCNGNTHDSAKETEMNGTNSVETVGDVKPDFTTTKSSLKKLNPDSPPNTDCAPPKTDSQAASPPLAAGDGPATVAASREGVKEKEVEDECLNKDEPELEDGWLDILGSGQLKKKVQAYI
ncbi:hypothetical protein BaRGS_00016118 [Batillaria attramentaria]|uniref:Uncharacterized protein n=1 Tax=Batillaria attramentaria TaxID=370345 RepID=A0ABD0L0Q1_9CAEN